MLVDIGINLMHKQFHRDREAVLQRAIQHHVGALILTGCSVKGSKEAQQYCANYDDGTAPIRLYCTAGVHPHDAKSCNDDTTLQTLRQLAMTPQVVAIGECGLDYNRNFSPPAVQRKWFELQLQLACELQLPVFLHERDAHDDFFQILQRYSDQLPVAIVHCFTGSEACLRAYLTLPNCSNWNHRMDLR